GIAEPERPHAGRIRPGDRAGRAIRSVRLHGSIGADVGREVARGEALSFTGGPDSIHGHGESRQYYAAGLLTRTKVAVDLVRLALQCQDEDVLLPGIDDPVFRDAGLGVFVSLRHQIAFAIRRGAADHFHDQVSAFPEFFLAPVVIFRFHEHYVRIAE